MHKGMGEYPTVGALYCMLLRHNFARLQDSGIAGRVDIKFTLFMASQSCLCCFRQESLMCSACDVFRRFMGTLSHLIVCVGTLSEGANACY